MATPHNAMTRPHLAVSCRRRARGLPRDVALVCRPEGEVLVEDLDFCGVIGEKGATVFIKARVSGCEVFPDAKLNFAENLLRRRDDALAIVFHGENKVERSLSFKELYDDVSRVRRVCRTRA